MAVADTKELAQCLAFAYFAEHPNSNEKDHDLNFYSLFSGKENVTKYKTKYLSKQFPIDKVKKEFTVSKTATGKISYHTTAKKVYNVANDCIKKGLFKFKIQEYEFLDQNDPFVLFVKDECLENIKKAFKLSYKIDALSAIDVFFVKKSSKVKILKEYKDKFSDSDTIIKNAIWGDGDNNDYTSVTERFMNSGELIPVSLKLPDNISDKTQIKRVQFHSGKDSAIEIDPYIKFLSVILDDPKKTEDIIDKVIDIDFKNFSTGDLLNWVFPVNFNYSSLIDPQTKKPMSNYDLRFNLFAQGYGAGWNGQFDKKTKLNQSLQWVGGVGAATFENFAKSYKEYRGVVKKMKQQRLDVFEAFCDAFKKDYPEIFQDNDSLYRLAKSELSEEKIIKATVDQKETKQLFDTLESNLKERPKNVLPLYREYQLAFIDSVRGSTKQYAGSIENQEKYIDAHYVHAQISYFILEGGPKFQLFFKQRLFLTIFGLITKKAHKIFDMEDYPTMRNIVHKTIQHESGKIKAEFSTAPHYIIS